MLLEKIKTAVIKIRVIYVATAVAACLLVWIAYAPMATVIDNGGNIIKKNRMVAELSDEVSNLRQQLAAGSLEENKKLKEENKKLKEELTKMNASAIEKIKEWWNK